jgi:hypothetical protein
MQNPAETTTNKPKHNITIQVIPEMLYLKAAHNIHVQY